MEEYEYRWSREANITQICLRTFCWAFLFGLPSLIVWVVETDKPVQEALVAVTWFGLTALCATLHTRKYWKRLSQRDPQLELRRDHLRAVQLGDQVIPWKEVTALQGFAGGYGDVATLRLVTTQGTIKLEIDGLDTHMAVIIKQAEAVALASRNRDSE